MLTTTVLDRHVARWIAPDLPGPDGVHVIGNPDLGQPGWDGRARRLTGIRDGTRTVIVVAPQHVAAVRDVIRAALTRPPAGQGLIGDPAVGAELAAIVGSSWPPGTALALREGVLRWTHLPRPQPAVGCWVDATDPRLPDWLRPFNGGVLAAFDARGAFLAAAGRKIHDPFGHEIAVGTVPAARGRGLARRLVVTAARTILREGAVATYLHDPANVPSMRVAEAAGFPDRGHRVLGLWPR